MLDKTLDQPVIFTVASNSIINTGLTKIEISVITSAAVIVNIWDRIITIVAVHRIHTDCGASTCTKGILAFLRQFCNFCKPLLTIGHPSGDRNLDFGMRRHLIHLSLDVGVVADWATAARGSWCGGNGDGSLVINKKLLETSLKITHASTISWLLSVMLVD